MNTENWKDVANELGKALGECLRETFDGMSIEKRREAYNYWIETKNSEKS